VLQVKDLWARVARGHSPSHRAGICDFREGRNLWSGQAGQAGQKEGRLEKKSDVRRR